MKLGKYEIGKILCFRDENGTKKARIQAIPTSTPWLVGQAERKVEYTSIGAAQDAILLTHENDIDEREGRLRADTSLRQATPEELVSYAAA